MGPNSRAKASTCWTLTSLSVMVVVVDVDDDDSVVVEAILGIFLHAVLSRLGCTGTKPVAISAKSCKRKRFRIIIIIIIMPGISENSAFN